MKTHTEDQYDFSQVSHSGQPGFEVVRSEKQDRWFFFGNDINGKATLFSQPYRSAESAERGLASLISLLKKNRGICSETAQGWFFTLKAGNHQETGRSLFFPDKVTCEQHLQFFQKVAQSTQPLAGPGPVRIAEKITTTAGTDQADSPARHAFRLFFYPAQNGDLLHGRIEKSGTGEQASFKGVDSQAILSFLYQHIKEWKPREKDEARSDTATAGNPAVFSTNALKLTVADRVLQPVVEFAFPAEEIPAGSSIEGCSVSLRHMESQATTTIHNVTARRDNGKEVVLVLNAAQILPGTYYLSASVWFHLPDQQTLSAPVYCLKGTAWLQLI